MNRKLAAFYVCLFVIGVFNAISAACGVCAPYPPCYSVSGTWPDCHYSFVCGSGFNSCCDLKRCYNSTTQGCCHDYYGYGSQVCAKGKTCCGSTECCDPGKPCCGGTCCNPDADECCFNGNCVHEKPATSVTVSLSMPGYIVDKVTSAINSIPGVSTSVNSASVSATESRADCCHGGSYIENGKGSVSGSATLSAELDGIRLWGGSFQHTFHSSFPVDWSATVDAEAGVFLDADFSVSGTVGRHYNSCKDEGCFYGSLDAGATISCRVTAGISGCVETPAGTYCGGASVTPASVSVSLSGSLHCNSSEDCDGCGGDVTVGAIDFSASVGCGPLSASWNVPIYEGD